MSGVPTKQTLSAAGVGPWLPLSDHQTPFNVAIGCVCSSNINATYSVEYAHDSVIVSQACSISRSGTVATLTLTNHGLTTNDSVIVRGSGDANLDGTFAIASVVDQNNITYAVSNTGALSALAKAVPMRVFTHSTLNGKTANADGNIAFPVQAIRLHITAWVAGYVTMIVNRAGMGT